MENVEFCTSATIISASSGSQKLAIKNRTDLLRHKRIAKVVAMTTAAEVDLA